jgi:hypothetical protein
MPIKWKLKQFRDPYGYPYRFETMWVAISGDVEIGSVARDMLSGSNTRFAWRTGYDPVHSNGWTNTPEEAKAALERAWFAWVKKAGLSEDPGPQSPPITGPGRKTGRNWASCSA